MQKNFREEFLLDRSITYLNFASFGACPEPVFNKYQQYQRELENEPAQFIAVKSAAALSNARTALGNFLNCSGNDLSFVTNPSYAVNIVARSLRLQPQDEILTTDLEYGACDMALQYYCNNSGAILKRCAVPLPFTGSQDLLSLFRSQISSRTKAIFISHITSSTSLLLPVKEVAALAKEHGILMIVDGAHAPAHIDLDLSDLDADIYVGACHKWMMAPKGSSFLFVRNSLQSLFDPLVISWGYDPERKSHNHFSEFHEVQGTRDFSAFLSVPDAITYMHDNNWRAVSQQCKEIVANNAKRFCELLKCSLLFAPGVQQLQMLSLPIASQNPEELQRYLFKEHKIEIPVMKHNGNVYLRYSVNAFNSQADLDVLFDAIQSIKKTTQLIL